MIQSVVDCHDLNHKWKSKTAFNKIDQKTKLKKIYRRNDNKYFNPKRPVNNVDMRELTYQPSKDNSLSMFMKNLAFYGFFPVICKRPVGLLEDEIMSAVTLPEERQQFGYIYKTSLVSDYNQQFLNEQYDLLDKKLSQKYGREWRTKLGMDKLAAKFSQDCVDGSIVIIPNRYVLAFPEEHNIAKLNENRDDNKRVFIKCRDDHKEGKWIQIVAFSNNLFKINPAAKLALHIKAQPVAFKAQVLVDFDEKEVENNIRRVEKKFDIQIGFGGTS